jgi:hypothetical protein
VRDVSGIEIKKSKKHARKIELQCGDMIAPWLALNQIAILR